MRVMCRKAKTCVVEGCGAKVPHDDRDCEPCPFDKSTDCVKVRTLLHYQGEEHELEAGT